MPGKLAATVNDPHITPLFGRLSRAARCTVLASAAASPLAAHVAIITGRGLLPAAVLAVAQAGVVATVLPGLLGRERRGWLPILALTAALAWGGGRLLGHGIAAAAGLSHVAVFGGLLTVFALTLLPGQTPLATRFARRLDPGFHSGMEDYTRAVTLAWCLFFAGQILASALLLLLAPTQVWSWFINVLDLPLVAFMFGAEYGVRRLRFREHRHVPLPTLVRAVRANRLVDKA